MKKEYEKKKKLVIFILAAVAVCLMGGQNFVEQTQKTHHMGDTGRKD